MQEPTIMQDSRTSPNTCWCSNAFPIQFDTWLLMRINGESIAPTMITATTTRMMFLNMTPSSFLWAKPSCRRIVKGLPTQPTAGRKTDY